jgi:drug/metabolite transporter (DMT)-like permease
MVLGSLGTGFAYILNYRVITEDGPIAASTVTYLLPIVAVFAGAVILREPVSLPMVVGIVAVLAGVIAVRAP